MEANRTMCHCRWTWCGNQSKSVSVRFPIATCPTFQIKTCVFLWPHRSIDDSLESRDPVALLGLRLAGKEELPVGRDDGDAVVPVVALRGRGQAGQDGVAVLLAADEHFAPGVGVLGGGTERITLVQHVRPLEDWDRIWSLLTRGSLKYMSRRSSMVNHLFLKPSVCCSRARQRNHKEGKRRKKLFLELQFAPNIENSGFSNAWQERIRERQWVSKWVN